MKIAAKTILIAIAIALLASMSLTAGTYTINTDPAADPTTGNKYIVLTPDDAVTTGVSFSATINDLEFGTVENWNWFFPNGTPNTSTDQNPGTVTFGDDAYGMANTVNVTFCHFGSNGEVCSNPVNNNIVVNVIKPSLVFNFSQYSSDDTAVVARNNYYGTVFTINVMTFWLYNPADQTIHIVGLPYEYKVTTAPVNSDANSSDLDIEEDAFDHVQFFKGNALDTQGNDTNTAFYRASVNPACLCDADIPKPTSPVFYALDAPGPSEYDTEETMALFGDNKYVCTKTLHSYPLYQYPNNPEDANLMQSHVFTYTCVSQSADGTGPYTWSAQ